MLSNGVEKVTDFKSGKNSPFKKQSSHEGGTSFFWWTILEKSSWFLA
jgi:hypothetical protein